jgi:RND family efflux transporter MFP subunit
VDDLLAQRRAAEAQVASASAALRNAGVQLNRELVSPQVAQSPGGMGMPSMMDQMFTGPMQSFMGTRQRGAERSAEIHARNTQVEQARQALLAARSDLQKIDARLRDARSVAPFDGVISLSHVEVGDPVQPGQPLLQYIDPQALQIQVDVPVRLRAGLDEGQALQARLDLATRPTDVTLARIFPTADVARHTVRMKFDLPAEVDAPVGSYAEVLFPDPAMPSRPTLAVPASAVVTRGGLQMVYLADADYRAELRFVRTGRRLDTGQVRVLSGLGGGECIVVDPRPGLKAGDRIAP